VCRPRTLLVVGSLTEFVREENVHHQKFESFERFRRSLRDPEILTFDELYRRARLALALRTTDKASREPDTPLQDEWPLTGHLSNSPDSLRKLLGGSVKARLLVGWTPHCC